MKKAISVLIAAVICLTCIIPAFASVGETYFKEYEAYISDPDGYDYINEDSGEEVFLPYNEKVTVSDEREGEAWCNYNDYIVQIDLNSLTKVKSEVDISEAVKLEHSMTYVVIADEGAKIRKGPAESYDELGTIPKDTEVTVTYGVTEETYYLSWAYCTFNGISGWIHVQQSFENYQFATKITKDSGKTGKIIVFADDLKLMSDLSVAVKEQPSEGAPDYVSDCIPAGTEFTYDTYYTAWGETAVYVEYNGVSGWLELRDHNLRSSGMSCATMDEIFSVYVFSGSADIYSEPFDGGEKLGTVPQGTGLISYSHAFKNFDAVNAAENWNYRTTNYVEYNGIKGWITNRDGDTSEFILCYLGINYSITMDEDCDIYTDYNFTEKSGTIPAGTQCYIVLTEKSDDGAYSAVVCDGKFVFTDGNVPYTGVTDGIPEEEMEKLIFGAPLERDYSLINVKEDTETDSTDTTVSAEAAEDTDKGISKTIIIVIAAVAVILVIVIIAVIAAKKKKSGKKEESKPEEKE